MVKLRSVKNQQPVQLFDAVYGAVFRSAVFSVAQRAEKGGGVISLAPAIR